MPAGTADIHVGSNLRKTEPCLTKPLPITVQIEKRVVPCLACGENDLKVLMEPAAIEAERIWLNEFHQRRTDGDLKDKADFTQAEPVFLMQCKKCGTLLRNPQPTPESLRRRYRNDEYGETTLEQLLEGERIFFRSKAASLDLTPGARVLEVGSFVGAFLLAARERGWCATGIDIGAETCAFSQGLGLDVLEGDLSTVDPGGPFDAVFVWNTFDQVNQPAEMLLHVREILRPGGLLVLRVPNGAFKTACLRMPDERTMRAQAYNNFLTFPYLVGYTTHSLEALLRECGFGTESIQGDVIVPLSTPDTKPYAVDEEARTKRQVLRTCSLHLAQTGEFLYPWMDVFART